MDKWNPKASTACLGDVEKEAIENYFFAKFVSSGVEFCDREVTEHHYPGDASPGLPYIQYGVKEKRDVASAYSHQTLVRAGIETIRRGDYPLYEFSKLECQKEGKRVRSIMCYPFHVHCALLSKLLAFSEVVKTLPQCRIGWSKWRLGVHRLCTDKKEPIFCEADARNFDAGVANCFVRLALTIYFHFFPSMTDEDVEAIIKCVVSGWVFSSNGELYWKGGGNSSGNPITTELNTFVHLCYWLLAWFRKFGSLDGFDDMSLDLYGDDVFLNNKGELSPSEFPMLIGDMPVEYPVESVKIASSPEGLTFLGCTFYKPKDFPFWLWRPAKPLKSLATLKFCEKGDRYVDLTLELSRVRGLLLDCAWDKDMWNILYPYQLILESEGAIEGVVGKHVDRGFVSKLTFGFQSADIFVNPERALRDASLGWEGKAMAPKGKKNKTAKKQAKKNGAANKVVGATPKVVSTARRVRLRRGLVSGANSNAVTTANGLQFALNALHPCNEQNTSAAMYPEDGHMPLHATRMQRTITVANPRATCTFDVQPNIDKCSWNLLVVTTPWPEYPWLVMATEGNVEPEPLSSFLKKYPIHNGDVAGVVLTNNWYVFSFPNFMDDNFGKEGVDSNDLRGKYQRIRVLGKGTTTYLNASRLYDGGRVICGQYPVASRFVDTFDKDAFQIDLDSLLEAIKEAVCVEVPTPTGVTEPHRTREAMNSVIHGHIHGFDGNGPVLTAAQAHSVTGHVHNIGAGPESKTCCGREPTWDSETNYVDVLAKDGTYLGTAGGRTTNHIPLPIPLKFDKTDACVPLTVKPSIARIKLVRDDTVANHPDWYVSEPPCQENALFYGDSKATTWEARKGTYQPMRIENYELSDCNTGDTTFYDLKSSSSREIQPNTFSKSFGVNVQGTGTWCVAYYRNISMQSSVTLKCVQYTDGVVNPIGPFANLTPLHADPDLKAIEFVSLESRRLAHAYPANYNDLGQILGEIFNVAKGIGKTVKGVAGSLENVPVIGGLATAVNSILSGLGL